MCEPGLHKHEHKHKHKEWNFFHFLMLMLALCLCCEYLSVNRAYISISVSIKSFLVRGIHKNKIQVRSVRICQLKTWRRR